MGLFPKFLKNKSPWVNFSYFLPGRNKLQRGSCKAFVFSLGGRLGAWLRSALENKKRKVIKGFVCALWARFHVTYTFGHVSKPLLASPFAGFYVCRLVFHLVILATPFAYISSRVWARGTQNFKRAANSI